MIDLFSVSDINYGSVQYVEDGLDFEKPGYLASDGCLQFSSGVYRKFLIYNVVGREYVFFLFCRIYCILSQQVNSSLLSILTHDQGGARGKLYSFTLQQGLQLL